MAGNTHVAPFFGTGYRATELSEIMDGAMCAFGVVRQLHTVGDFTFVEYNAWDRRQYEPVVSDRVLFHVYVDGVDTHVEAPSLDRAIVEGLAFKYDRPGGSHTARHLSAMLGL